MNEEASDGDDHSFEHDDTFAVVCHRHHIYPDAEVRS